MQNYALPCQTNFLSSQLFSAASSLLFLGQQWGKMSLNMMVFSLTKTTILTMKSAHRVKMTFQKYLSTTVSFTSTEKNKLKRYHYHCVMKFFIRVFWTSFFGDFSSFSSSFCHDRSLNYLRNWMMKRSYQKRMMKKMNLNLSLTRRSRNRSLNCCRVSFLFWQT